MPVKTGIQDKGMGMDPGFHRGDDSAGMTEGEIDVIRTIGFKPTDVKRFVSLPITRGQSDGAE